MTIDALQNRLPHLSDKKLHRYRHQFKLYANRVELLEKEAARRELKRRPSGKTTTLRVPSRLNYQ
ncbi:hypothetical protein [Hymenobacter sp. YC55]|uniref:hypothetical protein n=1 Tax=Hymenobacter sp. YC55 TaxID=3034019 RepID=UPI0023F97CF1|nr:hypothetical protein [Hymenobacter sp. YC55]MDF7810729.1 hypothetical protein [Hymenobacter sp. YC55]